MLITTPKELVARLKEDKRKLWQGEDEEMERRGCEMIDILAPMLNDAISVSPGQYKVIESHLVPGKLLKVAIFINTCCNNG